MSVDTVCGVLLTEDAITDLGDAIRPYLSDGPIGRYIYCRSAVQNGYFLDMVFDARRSNGAFAVDMRVSVPLHCVRFVVSAEDGGFPLGFQSGQQP